MNRKALTLTLFFSICLALAPNTMARNGANVSITSGALFIDDINGLDHKVGHTSTYTYTVQMESDINLTAATLGFVLYSPNGSLTNIVWNSVPANVGPWSEAPTWNFTGPQLSFGLDAFNGSLPSIWMTGGVSIQTDGSGYGPIGLTDGLEFTITLPGVDGAILCLDSAFFPPGGSWLASPAPIFEWTGGRGDLGAGGTRNHAFCVTTFMISNITSCPSRASLDHCDTLHYQTFFDPVPGNQPLTYSISTTGKGVASVDIAGNVTYIPGANETVALLITVTAAAPDGTSSECNTAVTITNNSPAIICPPNLVIIEGDSDTSAPAGVSDADVCDSSVYSLVSVFPTPLGAVTVDPATGAVTFATDSADARGADETDYTVCIGVSDGIDSDQCCLKFTVLDFIPPCPDSVTITHCEALSYFAFAIDLDPERQPVTYSIASTGAGVASVDTTGFVRYVPGANEIGEILITVTATKQDGASAECITFVSIINNAPFITCPTNMSVLKGASKTSPAASVSDPDACDSHRYTLMSVSPTPIGTVSVNPTTGAVTFSPDENDAIGGFDTPYDVCIETTDGLDVTQCCMVFTVLNTEAFCISIEQTDKTTPPGTAQGQQVDICLNYEAGSGELGGFDFLISYDNSALSFIGATEGNIFPDYEWEMFTYRFGPNGDCTGGCPSGRLRVIGLAEQNNGPHHPNNFQLVAGDQFACLKFLVSNDRNLECSFAPIRWDWLDCGDNFLVSAAGDMGYISRNVFDYIGTDMMNFVSGFRADITGADQTFPTSTGAPDSCDLASVMGVLSRFIDYKNGGVRIICANEIDDRGDINLNGLPYEIADAEMLIEYLVSGPSAFGVHVEASTAVSDINADGIPLTVADLVYLIRVIIGDALPIPKHAQIAEEVIITSKEGVVSSSADMGAALFVFDGIVNVSLLAANVDLRVGSVNGNTHALVFSLDSANFQHIATGDIISSNGTLASVDASDVNGGVLTVLLDFVTDVDPDDQVSLPRSFALHQNYPNPFNPSTTITIDFPRRSEYSLKIYNIRGQKVKSFSGVQGAGTLDIVWEPSKLPSGVYFYKLRAGDFVATKKMVLLK